MLMALLRGKLSREQENLEDILTSNVFGLLKYLPPDEGLMPFLSRAQSPTGDSPFKDVAPGAKVEYTFWPWHEENGCNGCEPDVELAISWPDGRKMRVFVECKYRSGKSSEEDDDETAEEESNPPVDQLAREWSNLVRLAGREGSEPVLVYLTADVGVPRKDIEASRRAFLDESSPAFSCCWLSWHQLFECKPKKPTAILADIAALLKRLDLVYYHRTFRTSRKVFSEFGQSSVVRHGVVSHFSAQQLKHVALKRREGGREMLVDDSRLLDRVALNPVEEFKQSIRRGEPALSLLRI